MALMDQARARVDASKGDNFTPKDPREFIPQDQHDAVDRAVAAGVKLIYSPQFADARQQAIQSQDPIPKRLADNITGLMLFLDQKSRGGLPQTVIFPAAVMLLNEAAEILIKSGQKVSQDDYNEATQILYVQIGKKLGGTDDQLMQGAEDALAKKNGGQDPSAASEGGADDPPVGQPGGNVPSAPGGPGPMTAVTPGMSAPPGGVAAAPPQQGG